MKTIDKIIETEKKVTAKVTVKVTVNQKKIIEAISLGNRGIIFLKQFESLLFCIIRCNNF